MSSTINIVKYYFYRGSMPKDPDRVRRFVALAYQTARENRLYPKEVLIRSDFHDTTNIDGIYQPDPNGTHVTLCYKDEAQVSSGTHIACHAYTAGRNSWELLYSTHRGEKSDSVKRHGSNKPVWPGADKLVEAPEIGYGHIDEP